LTRSKPACRAPMVSSASAPRRMSAGPFTTSSRSRRGLKINRCTAKPSRPPFASLVDVASGLIVHHDVDNAANDGHLLHPMAVAAKAVLGLDQLQVLTNGGHSNAREVARCERENIEVLH
jgi:hypothetical protein